MQCSTRRPPLSGTRPAQCTAAGGLRAGGATGGRWDGRCAMHARHARCCTWHGRPPTCVEADRVHAHALLAVLSLLDVEAPAAGCGVERGSRGEGRGDGSWQGGGARRRGSRYSLRGRGGRLQLGHPQPCRKVGMPARRGSLLCPPPSFALTLLGAAQPRGLHPLHRAAHCRHHSLGQAGAGRLVLRLCHATAHGLHGWRRGRAASVDCRMAGGS